MDRTLCITDGTSAALHALALAALQGESISASAAAERLGVSPSYLSKVLQGMASRGIIESTRGIGGGFSLRKPADETSCLEVVEALEGSTPDRYCLFENPVCAARECAIMHLCEKLRQQVREALNATTIADLARSFEEGWNPDKVGHGSDSRNGKA
ncbi:MAG: Rrf2 family transcriptional regulator [Spirochaetaceae bacterium]|nr:Rrf2 family transcriptional regulator [Spirochaetaceae bacterium]